MTRQEIEELITEWSNGKLILDHFCTEKRDIAPLMQVVFDDTQPIFWRAAYVMDQINDQLPQLIHPYYHQILEALFETKNQSKRRHYLRVLSSYPVEAENAGRLFDYCLETFSDQATAIAVRVHALQILYLISQLEPDLKAELRLIVQQELERDPSAGIRSRGKRILGLLAHGD